MPMTEGHIQMSKVIKGHIQMTEGRMQMTEGHIQMIEGLTQKIEDHTQMSVSRSLLRNVASLQFLLITATNTGKCFVAKPPTCTS